MSVYIKNVVAGSPCGAVGIVSGSELLKIGRHEINDVLSVLFNG